MEKIKSIIYSSIIIVLIAVLGFAPAGEKPSFLFSWGNFGAKMVEAGVIDPDKYASLYETRGGLSEADKKLLFGKNKEVTIDSENGAMMLNMLWAFGLSNKNPILETGPMMDPKYGGADRFASTGGWTLAQGNAMDHYSMHSFLVLTDEEQKLVEKTSKNIYRPCCKNPAFFPDCNHGMAMLGLLQILAKEGYTESEIYEAAQKANREWFPELKEASGCAV